MLTLQICIALVKICCFFLHIVYVSTQGGWTALMWAAYKGRTDVADLLLEKGANPNITGQVWRLLAQTPLCPTSVYQIYIYLLSSTYIKEI